MKILFLEKRILFPSDTGGKIRTLNILRYLARWHHVTYLCNVQPGDEPHLGQMRALGVRLETIPWRETPHDSWKFYLDLACNLLSPYPFTVAKDYDPALRGRAEQLLAEEPYDLLVCDFVQMARNAIGLDVQAKVLFQHNVEAQILRRHVEVGGGRLHRKYMTHQWRKMRRFEAEAGSDFDAVIAVSQPDRLTFEQQYGWKHVRAIDTAVDLEHFGSDGYVERENRVVFLGSMDWLPNQDAVRFFVDRIWPLVRRSHPLAVFQIVGRNPSRAVTRLAETDGVEVVGTVPDVRPYLAEASVIVVPLRIGGGTRIKIVEAMAMGKAIVSTSLGAEGLKVNRDEHVLLADTPDAFANAVNGLLGSRSVRDHIGESARRLVTQHFSAETVARQFEKICEEASAQNRIRSFQRKK